MKLNQIAPNVRRKDSLRLARGSGSGSGKTAGRGHKGQKSRAGGKIRLGFEGGQTPFYRRIPKFGFKSRRNRIKSSINFNKINRLGAQQLEVPFKIIRNSKLTKRTKRIFKIFNYKIHQNERQ